MIFIFPIGHSQQIFRIPYVSFGIIALCSLILIFSWGSLKREATQAENLHDLEDSLKLSLFYAYEESQGRDTFETYFGDASNILELKSDLKERIDRFWEQALQGEMFPPGSDEAESIEDYKLQRQQLLSSGVAGHLGFTPKPFKPWTLLTCMFVHFGIAHLFFNMFFLYLAGPPIEDSYGRGAFLGLYLTGGIVGTLGFTLFHPHSTVPLVGASGAVSALFGMVLVRFYKIKVKFWYYYFLVRLHSGTFELPAWFVVIFFWFVPQLIWFWVGQYLEQPVAYEAHIFGFLFGVAAAATLTATGWDQKLLPAELREEAEFIDRAIKPVPVADMDHTEAMIEAGREAEAVQDLRSVLHDRPGHLPSRILLASTLLKTGKAQEALPEVEAVLEALLRGGNAEKADSFLAESMKHMSGLDIDPKIRFRLASLLQSRIKFAAAAGHYQHIASEQPESPLAPKALLAAAELWEEKLHDIQRAEAIYRSLLERYPDSPQAARARLRSGS